MAKRTIKHASFSYRVEADDPVRSGEKVLVERKAGQGQTVEIPRQEDLDRGERFGAFVNAAVEVDAGGEPEEEQPTSALSDSELVDWIKEDHPTVSEVVEAAEGDPEQARRLLTAEDRATGGDSRKSAVSGLTKIIETAQ